MSGFTPTEWDQPLLAALEALTGPNPSLRLVPVQDPEAWVDEERALRRQGPGPTVAWRAEDPRPERVVTGPIPGVQPEDLRALFDDQARSRHLDHAARTLRARNQGFYTIASSGHEGNAALAFCARPSDPALLHYRSGAFFLRRLAQAGLDGVDATLLSLMAAADDPASGGRHKVWGSREAWVIPQTSTIASHLPRAVGLALAIETLGELVEASGGASYAGWTDIPDDAIVICSFGDASANHATGLSGLNGARIAHYRGDHLPVLFVCEDNGLGISVPTPMGWIEDNFSGDADLEYFDADACHLVEALRVIREAVHFVRQERAPAFLHLYTVRLGGHAGTDAESAYRSSTNRRYAQARDPLLQTAKILMRRKVMSAEEILARYRELGAQVQERMNALAGAAVLADRAAVLAPLSPAPSSEALMRASAAGPKLQAPSPKPAPSDPAPQVEKATLAQGITAALEALLEREARFALFGEDVGRKGGVYGVTKGLQKRFGEHRVFDTILDETHILGLGLGYALAGFLPCPEIQYLAYVANAVDQLRGEAASQSFFSNGRFRNPLIVRVPGLAYQKGFGGHFHNDNGLGFLLEIPGITVLAPARADDAAFLFERAARLTLATGRVIVIIEPIALYHQRDLHEEGDGGWMAPPREDASTAQAHADGSFAPRCYEDFAAGAPQAAILTFANGLWMSLRVARRLAREGLALRVVDLRCLAPLPWEALDEALRGVDRVLIVDECRRHSGISASLMAGLLERRDEVRLARVTAADSYIPIGPAADLVLVGEEEIAESARTLISPRRTKARSF